MNGNLVQEVMSTARQTVNRVLSFVDAFRPKIIIKKPLTELRLLQGEAIVDGELVGGLVERIRSRIEELRTAASTAVSGQARDSEAKGLVIVEEKGKRKGVLY